MKWDSVIEKVKGREGKEVEKSTEVEKWYFALQTLIFFTLQSVFIDDLPHLSMQTPAREGEKDNER